jgi:ssDNA-binding Zn-finger/Zn-ribbon topoisomerase 1
VGNNNAGCLSIFFPFLKSVNNDNESADNEILDEALPYAKRDDFFSPSELSFYKILKQVVNDNVVIYPKVGLKEIFFVKSKDRGDFSKYHNKIDRKHVDFLLCNSYNLQPICAIELDDASHLKQDRIERDIFVDKVFKTAELPLIRFVNKKSYVIADIADKLAPIINPKINIEHAVIQDANTKKVDDIGNNHICPKCGISMVERTVSKGEKKGKKFYGCSNYPRCRETINL